MNLPDFNTSPYVKKFRDEIIPMWNVSSVNKSMDTNIRHMEKILEITNKYVEEAPNEVDRVEVSKYVEGAEFVLERYHDMSCGS